MKKLEQIHVKKQIKGVKLYIGESIERFCERAEQTGAPIEASSPIIYTERKEGVIPEYNIRTDKWERAQEAMQAVADGHRKTRTNKIQQRAQEQLKQQQIKSASAES